MGLCRMSKWRGKFIKLRPNLWCQSLMAWNLQEFHIFNEEIFPFCCSFDNDDRLACKKQRETTQIFTRNLRRLEGTIIILYLC